MFNRGRRKKRNEVIGLTDDLYDEKEKAKRWYRNIVKIIRPDVKSDDKTRKAFEELKRLYNIIVGSFEED